MRVDEERNESRVDFGAASHGIDQAVSIPASLEAYVATRAEDASKTASKMIQRCAQTGLWSVVTAPLQESISLGPCRFGAELMLRRTNGLVAAAIVAPNWSVSLLGDEVWIDVASPAATAMALVGKPVRTRIELPFLSPELMVGGSTQMGSYHRLHCR